MHFFQQMHAHPQSACYYPSHPERLKVKIIHSPHQVYENYFGIG